MRSVIVKVLWFGLLGTAPLVFGLVKGAWAGGALLLFSAAVGDILEAVRDE